ncbi:MAG: DOMON-like domain-containing protein [Deltaproteobacteria bacterium]|nr:DOMON-like domain-containing protein [Deltaproteobacteria bacterium]
MKERRFILQPFASEGPRPGVEITGHLTRRADAADAITIATLLQGQLADVLIPAPAAAPARRHRLWEGTCFEFFLAVPGAPQYWELNLSPTGDWNVYRFADYRQDLAAEPAYTSLPFTVQSRPRSVRLTLEVDLAGIVPAGQPLEVAVAAVIKTRDGQVGYWALTHLGPRPDFHRRDGFLIAI